MSDMIFPDKLKAGDTVALLAPSSPVTSEEAASARSMFEGMGYGVRLSKFADRPLHGYEAGPAEERARELNEAFRDKDIRAIFCLRGGDSSCRIMNMIDTDAARENPKIFVGYSDITNIHTLLNQRSHLVTFHGPMVVSNMLTHFDEYTKHSLWETLSSWDTLEFKNPDCGAEAAVRVCCPFETIVGGTAEGRLAGGNLTLITSMTGTPYELDTRGKILLLEDTHEDVPRLSRMLHQLWYAGKLEDAAGIILGDFTDCAETKGDPSWTAREMMRDFCSSAGIHSPVLAGVRTGHDFPMGTMPLGAMCRLDADRQTLTFFRR